jgi:hypothetical protein
MPTGIPDFCALHIFQGMEYYWRNDFHTALIEFDQALAIREDQLARFDRAHALLALGRYREGFRELAVRRQRGDLTLTETGHRLRRELPQWNGEPGRRLVLSHEAGHGDSIMFVRFVNMLRQQYEPQSIVLDMPGPLRVLAAQLAPLGDDGDAWCSLFDVPAFFDAMPTPPYLRPDAALVAHWRSKVANGGRRRIGIAWSSNTNHFGEHEFQTRSLPLEQFLELLPFDGALFSLQHHERDEAERAGVRAPELKDFADVAALASLMDVIVSIDTAALHVAGAIGHPNVYALLPFAPTWRWHAGNRWYPQIKLCQAREPGDWPSAFAQMAAPQ